MLCGIHYVCSFVLMSAHRSIMFDSTWSELKADWSELMKLILKQKVSEKMNAAKHYIYKSRLKSSYFLLFNHLRNYKLGSLEIKNFQKNMQSKCVCHPKMPRIMFISDKMVGRYTLILNSQVFTIFGLKKLKKLEN